MFRKAGTTALVAVLLAVAGCGGEQQQDPDADVRAPEETVAEENRAVEQTTVAGGTTLEGAAVLLGTVIFIMVAVFRGR